MTTYKDILCKKLKNIEHVKAVKKINENDNYQDESVKALSLLSILLPQRLQ